MSSFTDKVVIVTGATSGIGKDAAIALAREGAKVVLSGRRETEGEAVVATITAAGGTAVFFKGDMSKEADIEALVNLTVQRFGRLDMAFNNAGVESAAGGVTEATEAEYRKVFDLNVWGVLALMKHEIRAIVETKGSGSIVNNSSIVGFRGFGAFPIYTASKWAVEGLSKSAALEYAAQGIRVNTVAPGPIVTEMMNRAAPTEEARAGFASLVPTKAIGDVSDITRAVIYLLDPKNVYVTGASLNVDGGVLAKLM